MIPLIVVVIVATILIVFTLCYNSSSIYRELESSLKELNENIKQTNNILLNIENNLLKDDDERNSILSEMSEDILDLESILLGEKKDPLLLKIVEDCVSSGSLNFYSIQKRYHIGVNRRKRIVDELYSKGILSRATNEELENKVDRWTSRKVLINKEDFEKMKQAGEFN